MNNIFAINEIIIGSYWYDVKREKMLFYTTLGKLTAEISMSQQQYRTICENNPTLESMWNALADLFGDKEDTVKRCPVCGRTPSVEYSCGEYFISGREGCRFCGEFSEMHLLKNAEIKAWNSAVDDENKFHCPNGGDETDDCADCAYSLDYHLVGDECIERTLENDKKKNMAYWDIIDDTCYEAVRGVAASSQEDELEYAVTELGAEILDIIVAKLKAIGGKFPFVDENY